MVVTPAGRDGRQQIVSRGPRDLPPATLSEAWAAAADSVRLAVEAGPWVLAAATVAGMGSAAARAWQLRLAGEAMAALGAGSDGAGPRPAWRGTVGIRTVATLGAASVVSGASRILVSELKGSLELSMTALAEARVLDAVAGAELAEVDDPAFQDRVEGALMGVEGYRHLVSTLLEVPLALVAAGAAGAATAPAGPAAVPLALVAALPQLWAKRAGHDYGRSLARGHRERFFLRNALTAPALRQELIAFGATGFVRDRYDELARAAAQDRSTARRKLQRRNALRSLVSSAAAAPAVAWIGVGALRGSASVAGAAGAALETRSLVSALSRAGQLAVHAVDMAAGVRAHRDFALSPPAPRVGAPAPATFERIHLEGVSFAYPGSPRRVLDGLDFEIGRAEVVALVGENGSGKTTLAKLVCGLYQPSGGTIRWDGVDLAGCDPAGVRSHVAMVFQDFARYPAMSAAHNIAIGRPELAGDRAAIVAAAHQAGAHDAIAALPDGYDTVMSRQFGGSDLSTGQWQRVALARAFLRQAPLVVLDEPTAALDPRAEAALFATVAALYRDRAALLISHRLSSVRFADRICVLAGGRIVESGTHDELVGAGGAYAELFAIQARAYR